MGRGVWTRRWLAASGGVLINGLILGALVLIEEPGPRVEEQPPILVELERPQRRTPQSKPSPAGFRSSSRAVRGPESRQALSDSAMPTGEAMPAVEAPPVIDPQWRVDQKTLDRWKLTEGAPAAGWGRYSRACAGLSSEHMTPDEKERCYNGWKDRPATKRPSPDFIGPIDERHWEVAEPSPPRRTTADEDKRRRRDLCRVVGQMRKANPSGPPLVRQGACR